MKCTDNKSRNSMRRNMEHKKISALFHHIFEHDRKVLISLMYAQKFGGLIGQVKHVKMG